MATEPYRWHYDYPRIAWDSGFHFNNQKSSKTFDRNGIALLDIDQIINERNIGLVEHHIQNIIEYTLDNEEARILDPNFVKLFKLNQLAVEYLTYCKKYLDSTVNTIKKDLQKLTEENQDLKKDVIFYQNEVHKLKKKIKDLKATLQIVQKYQTVGLINEPVASFQCNECKKVFVNIDFLKAHIIRRHPNSNQQLFDQLEKQVNTTPVHKQFKDETDRLQMEIKELKEKLNNTERYYQSEQQLKQNSRSPSPAKNPQEQYYKQIENLNEQFESLKTQIESEMQLLKNHKLDQDKYDEIMETIIHKLDEKTHQISEKNSIQIQTVAEVYTEKPVVENKEVQAEMIIQEQSEKSNTEPEILQTPIYVTSRSSSPVTNFNIPVSPSPRKSPQNITDISKVKEEIGKEFEEKAKENMERLGQELSDKMTYTVGKLQEQLELFWNKLQEIEIERNRQAAIIEQKKPETPKRKVPTTYKDEAIQLSARVISDTSDINSDTESIKQEKLTPIPTPRHISMVPLHKNEKITRNLLAELKNKVQEKNTPQKRIEITSKQEIKAVSESEDSEESESETETSTESEDNSVDNNKPSKIVTPKVQPTPQSRPVKILETAMPSKPEISKSVKNDLKVLFYNRLKDLGIDPEWTKIPNKTFIQKFEQISHERNMAAKNIKSYLEIRKNIVEEIESKLKTIKRIESPSASPSSPLETKTSKVKSIFTNMKNKAKNIKSAVNKSPTTANSIYKLTLHRNIPTTPSRILKEKNQTKATIVSSTPKKQPINQPEVPKLSKPIIMYDTDTEEETETHSERNASTIIAKTKKLLRKSKSESSMEIMDLSDASVDAKRKIPVSDPKRSMDSILEIKKELRAQLDEKTDDSTENEIKDNEIISVSPRTTDDKQLKVLMEAEKLESLSSGDEFEKDAVEEDKIQKSALKNNPVISTVKKKVLFDLQSEPKTNEENKLNNPAVVDLPKKTIVKSNTMFQGDWNDSSSIDSSIFDLNKKPEKEISGKADQFSTKAVINVTTKHNIQDDLSDWDISDIN